VRLNLLALPSTQALDVGGFKTNLNCKYDYNANKDGLKEVSLSGDLIEAGSSDDVAVGYEVTRNVPANQNNIKLTASTHGTTVFGEYADSQLREVGARREVDIGDQKLNVEPSWRVQAKEARIKLMSAVGGGKDRVSAEVNYANGDVDVAEIGYQRELEEGRRVKATLTPRTQNLEVEYKDDKFEQGASWTATANVPLDNANNILDAAKVTVSRAWNW